MLVVLDGWGLAPPGPGNAISLAEKPHWDRFLAEFPHSQLMAHGRYVGLLPNQEGNSESGHMNIGAGRVVRQDITYVSEAIKDRTFFKNMAFREALKHAKKYGTKVHLMGLLSNGNSAHSSPDHLHALLELVHEEGVPKTVVHMFTDGRDSPPHSAQKLLQQLRERMHPNQEIGTVIGRFYAMDRNKWWNRTDLAYHCIVSGEGVTATSAEEALLRAYARGETDEFIIPTVIVDDKKRPVGTFDDNDVIIFFNLRSDRARQLAKCFVQHDFEKQNDNSFKRRKVPKNTRFAAMTDFGPDLPHVFTAFPSRDVQHGLTETLAPLRQFYIAESEKYAHVTYFFNGGYAEPRFGEERMRVPSQFVAHYDDCPEMRARTITDEVIRRLRSGLHDFVVCNFANADMVAHTGDIAATVEAVQIIDDSLGKLAETIASLGGTLVVTADHGNAEWMKNGEGDGMITEHSTNPVPFVIVNDRFKGVTLGDGMLADVAPTILDIMGIPKPPEMTGFSLIRER
ncbi:hypothetical protein AMJ57_03465 [Parcubacteria bacterium SG8_24]|nr:MAG: hypothetical protein AMJ57_03465 [Parcubacteria bacterium SG8_24]